MIVEKRARVLLPHCVLCALKSAARARRSRLHAHAVGQNFLERAKHFIEFRRAIRRPFEGITTALQFKT